MIDWNGDGKIDPTDIGITIAALTDDEEETDQGPPPKSGCLTASLMMIASALAFAAILI